MLMRVYPHSQQGQKCTKRGGEGNCAVEGGMGGLRKRGRGRSGDKKKRWGREGEGVGAYTLLTTTSSHGPSFSGTYYSAAL